MKMGWMALLVGGLVCLSDVALATDWSQTFSGRFVTLGEYKTDTDFSSVGPTLDPDGQAGGFLGLLFEPKLVVESETGIQFILRKEVRIGGAQLGGDHAVEFLGKDLALRLAPKKGFQATAGLLERMDSTGLVLSQPVLGFGAGWAYESARYEFWIAQAEENSPEGLGLASDNFSADHWLGGLDLYFGDAGQSYSVTLLGSLDRNETMEERRLGALSASAERETDVYRSWLQGVVGMGDSEVGALRGERQNVVFWGGQLGMEYFRKGARFALNSLLLSGDDGEDGNDLNGAFQWSGKSRSRTIVLTEDERFRRNQSVALAATNPQGVYRELASGLHVSEIAVGYGWDGKGEIMAYGALGQSLEQSYTGGDGLLGIETGLELTWNPVLDVDVFSQAAVVVPGTGGAYIYNGTNIRDEEPLWVMQFGVEALF